MKVSQETKGNELINSTLNQPVTKSSTTVRDAHLFKFEIYMPINISLFRLSFEGNNRTIPFYYCVL